MMRSTCRYCNGTKMLIKYPCTECEGKGSTVQRKKITVPVPPGKYLFHNMYLTSLITSSTRDISSNISSRSFLPNTIYANVALYILINFFLQGLKMDKLSECPLGKKNYL